MTKILEAAIAIILLLFFVLFATNLYSKEPSSINYNKYKDILQLKAENQEFRDLVNTKDADNIYYSLEPYMDIKYTIEVCDYLQDDCQIENIDVLNSKTYSFDYYFVDINKTLNIIIKE